MSTTNVLLLGASGHDGPFLAEAFISNGCEVTCLSKNSSERLSKLPVNQLIEPSSFKNGIQNQILDIKPDVIVNLISKSSVAYCEKNSNESRKINYELVKKLALDTEICADILNKDIKFIQASSSEMFGKSSTPCSEDSPKFPISVYGHHKLLSHQFLMSKNIHSKRVDFKSVILFNHESEFRPDHFVSSKVSRAAAEVYLNRQTLIEFGNIESERDWGYAIDYMYAFAKVALFGQSASYVIASEKLNSVKTMLELAFSHVGENDYEKFVKINESLKRQNDTTAIVGNYAKLRNEFDWEPKVSFSDMVKKMVDFQIQKLENFSNAHDF